MAFSTNVWNQVKNLTADKLIRALERDGWERDVSIGKQLGFYKTGVPGKRIVIHYHPQKTYGPKLLKALIEDIGWTETDLIRLKIIK